MAGEMLQPVNKASFITGARASFSGLWPP